MWRSGFSRSKIVFRGLAFSIPHSARQRLSDLECIFGKILFEALCFYILDILWIQLIIDTIFICSYMNYIYVIFAILN
jgi:hypothetical protein